MAELQVEKAQELNKEIETDESDNSPNMDTGNGAMESEIINTITTLVQQGHVDHVEVILGHGNHDDELRSNTWDLVPLLCTHLTSSNQEESPRVVIACEFVLDYLCDISNPKELILVLLEQAESFIDDVKFKVLLPPIGKCLQGLPTKRSHSLAIALETLYRHVKTLPIPESQDLEGQERSLLYMDPDVRRSNSVLAAMLDFLAPFVKDASCLKGSNQNHVKERDDLVTTLIKMLAHPLIHLDLTYEPIQMNALMRPGIKRPGMCGGAGDKVPDKQMKTKSESRLNGEKLVNFLSQLRPDYVKLVTQMQEFNRNRAVKMAAIKDHVDLSVPELEDVEDYGIEDEIPPEGLSCLVYLTLGESLGLENFPTVYTPQYRLEFSLPFIAHFLECPLPFIIEKGQKLLKSSLDLVGDLDLNGDLLEMPEVTETLDNLMKVVVHCSSKEIRQKSLQIFPLFLSKFDYKGRYLYLKYILNKTKHSGLRGYTISLLKNEIDITLKQPAPSEHFIGSNLEHLLLGNVFKLPDGAESDLLEESDYIQPALNLLRYLLIRDPQASNVTSIWNYVAKIDNNFLGALRTGINMSRAHYQMELKNARDGKLEVAAPDGAEMSVTVGNQVLPPMTKEQQESVIQRALFTFDMMDSVLARVAEILDQQKLSSVSNEKK